MDTVRTYRHLLAGVGVLALSGALVAGTITAGASPPQAAEPAPVPQELLDAALDDGKVVIYTSQAQDPVNLLAERFEAAYPGIDVEVIRGTDADNIPRIEIELQGSGIADLMVTSDFPWLATQAAAGSWLDPVGPELTGDGAYDVDAYLFDGGVFEVGAIIAGIGWNTDLHPAGLTDYTDLLDPSLAGGGIGVIEPSSSTIVDYYLFLEETFGPEFVEQLAAQNPRIYPSSLPLVEALGAGEIAASSYGGPTLLVAAQERGAPIDFTLSPTATWGARFYGVIPNTAPRPSAAQLFANFMVTAAGQEPIAAAASSVLPDIPGALLTDAEVRPQNYDALTSEVVAAYQERWDELFR